MPMTSPLWTEAPTVALQHMRAIGLSYFFIAAQLTDRFNQFYSRNAVAGKVSRMKLPNPTMPRNRPEQPARAVARRRGRFRPPAAKPHPPPFVAVWEAFPGGSLDLIDLKPASCRYPYGDAAPYRFCGATKLDGSSYCPFHAQLSYRRAGVE